MPLLADVASPDEMGRAVDRLAQACGRLDIAVANAGINGVWAPIDELAPEEWDRTIAVNLRGTFLTLRYAVPHLKRAGGGSVVIVSSINGTRTFTSAGATAYACSKAAQLALGQMAAVELGKHGIRVNVVCPGAIETEIGDNTLARDTEAAEVPAEYPAGEIPLTGKPPGPRRGRRRTGAVPFLRPLAPHQRLAGLDRRGAIAADVGADAVCRVAAHAGRPARPLRRGSRLAAGLPALGRGDPAGGGTRDPGGLRGAGLRRLRLPRLSRAASRRLLRPGVRLQRGPCRTRRRSRSSCSRCAGEAAALAGVTPETLEQVSVTEYPPGAAIGWHRDRAVFGDVLGVSLGSPCLFRLRRKAGASWQRASLRLEPRSAYLLRGPARTEWEHSIPPIPRGCGTR